MRTLFLFFIAVLLPLSSAPLHIETFHELPRSSAEDAAQRLLLINSRWDDSYVPLLIESYRFTREREIRKGISTLLKKKTGVSGKGDLDDWWQWVWERPYNPHPDYATFKEKVYERVDARFSEYFDRSPRGLIRLDEVRWGGVIRDGIPPLKNPKVLSATSPEARYLKDDNIVFGVSFNGESRAYPKRILAWHEMVKDKVGGRSINGVYCTLCGSMIVYDTKHKGTHYELGTSGFLYRSNKLMYDHKTQSMWSTIEGKPVIGPLVGKGIQLEPLYVVTTTWGEWKKRHPETTVLSLWTGHQRDYGEGVAYKSYFSTDRLMFDVPDGLKDKSLKNKDSILALRLGDGEKDKVAFSPKFLKKNPLYHYGQNGKDLVILTDSSGASRVYVARGTRFQRWDLGGTLADEQGKEWKLTENALLSTDGKKLPRFPAHNAFWFGWKSAFPKTRLVK